MRSFGVSCIDGEMARHGTEHKGRSPREVARRSVRCAVTCVRRTVSWYRGPRGPSSSARARGPRSHPRGVEGERVAVPIGSCAACRSEIRYDCRSRLISRCSVCGALFETSTKSNDFFILSTAAHALSCPAARDDPPRHPGSAHPDARVGGEAMARQHPTTTRAQRSTPR